MTIPSLLFAILISTFYGVAFHVWRGGSAGRLILYVILGWIGFWAGHLIAGYFGWSLLNFGPINFGIATIFSFLFLIGGYWLGQVQVERK
jgi:uncharacterized membrane protein YeaQ/YmgE (transglycosylase-associated protein family)